MRLAHWINLLLFAALVGGSVWAWPQLPERIPAHLGVDGEVTRWSERTLWSWFLIPLVTLAVVALNYGIAALLPARPHLVNLPDRRRFLALPPERRAPVIARMQDLLYGFSAPLIALLAAVQWTLYRAAVGTKGGGDVLVVLLIAFLLTPVLLVVWLPRVQRELQRQVREHAAATEDARAS